MWMAPTYYSRVFDLLPPGLRLVIVPKKAPVATIDWTLKPLELFLHGHGLELPEPVHILPPTAAYVLRGRMLATPPWNNNRVVWCEFCKIERPPFLLVDVEGFPTDLTDGRKWACDGCITRWFRQGKPMNGSPVTLRAWAKQMRDVHGAPDDWFNANMAHEDEDRTHYSL